MSAAFHALCYTLNRQICVAQPNVNQREIVARIFATPDKRRERTRSQSRFKREIVAARQTHFHLFEHQPSRRARRARDIEWRKPLRDSIGVDEMPNAQRRKYPQRGRSFSGTVRPANEINVWHASKHNANFRVRAPTANTAYGNALITRFESAPHGFLPPFFALDGAQQNIAPNRRSAATDCSLPAPPSAARNPDSRENLVPGCPVCAKLASALPMAPTRLATLRPSLASPRKREAKASGRAPRASLCVSQAKARVAQRQRALFTDICNSILLFRAELRINLSSLKIVKPDFYDITIDNSPCRIKER